MLFRLKNLAITTLLLATTATGSAAFAGSPKNGGTAPEFTGIDKWRIFRILFAH